MRRLAAMFVLALALAACADGDDATTSVQDPTPDDETAAADAEASKSEGTPDAEGTPQAEGTPEAEATTATSGLEIVATTSILGDLVSSVVQDDADVEVLLPIGADPHDFAPSAAQAGALRDADLVVANGLDLEEGLVSLLEGAAEDGVLVFEATDHAELIPFDGDDGHGPDDDDEHGQDDDEHGQDDDDELGHGDEDPHVWFDPVQMASVVEALGAELTSLDDSIDWEARAAAVCDELLKLDAEIRDILDVIPEENRVLVTNHEALGYFAHTYDFEVAATIIPGGTSLAEPSAADLQDVIDIVSDTGVSAIFAETTAGAGLADVVAAEIGSDVEVIELFTESLSAPDGPASTYVDMMRTNATRIAEGLAS